MGALAGDRAPASTRSKRSTSWIYLLREDTCRSLFGHDDDWSCIDRRRGIAVDRDAPTLARVYMTALAEHIAEKKLRPLTDETSDHVALSGLSIERLAQALLSDTPILHSQPSANEREEVLFSVAFRTLVPKDISNMHVDKILAFRNKYPNKRARFQAAVAKFLSDREWLGRFQTGTCLRNDRRTNMRNSGRSSSKVCMRSLLRLHRSFGEDRRFFEY